jgi:hypothetical protein
VTISKSHSLIDPFKLQIPGHDPVALVEMQEAPPLLLPAALERAGPFHLGGIRNRGERLLPLYWKQGEPGHAPTGQVEEKVSGTVIEHMTPGVLVCPFRWKKTSGART